MNKDVLKVFKTFIKDQTFWETAYNTTITRSPGLSPHLKTLFENIITVSCCIRIYTLISIYLVNALYY